MFLEELINEISYINGKIVSFVNKVIEHHVSPS